MSTHTGHCYRWFVLKTMKPVEFPIPFERCLNIKDNTSNNTEKVKFSNWWNIFFCHTLIQLWINNIRTCVAYGRLCYSFCYCCVWFSGFKLIERQSLSEQWGSLPPEFEPVTKPYFTNTSERKQLIVPLWRKRTLCFAEPELWQLHSNNRSFYFRNIQWFVCKLHGNWFTFLNQNHPILEIVVSNIQHRQDGTFKPLWRHFDGGSETCRRTFDWPANLVFSFLLPSHMCK